MTENINKNISVWRGDTTPPTNYHIWIKSDGTLYEYVNGSWKTYNELIPVADAVHNGLLSNTDKLTIDIVSSLNILAKNSNESLATINYNSDTVEIETELKNLKTLIPTKKSIEINPATQETAGVLSASDKKKIDNAVPLDEHGLISSQYLPSYVDDVLEYDTVAQFPKTGESGKIYVDISAKLTYRWTGSQYTEISKSLALGTTSTTAYAGDLGVADRYDIDNIIANGMIPFAGFVSINASEMESGETTSSYKSVSGIGYGVYFNTKINKFVYKNNNKYYPLWTNCKYWGYTESLTSPVNVIPYSNLLYRLSGSDSAGDPLINVYKFSAYNNQLKQLTTYERSLIQTNTNNISKNASDIVTLGDKINTVRLEVTDDTKEILPLTYLNIELSDVNILDSLNSEYFRVVTIPKMNFAILALETDSSGNPSSDNIYYRHWSNCERWGLFNTSDNIRYPKINKIYEVNNYYHGTSVLCAYNFNKLLEISLGVDQWVKSVYVNEQSNDLVSVLQLVGHYGDDESEDEAFTIPAATEKYAGVMTANDKKTLTSVNATVTSLSPRVDEINDTVDTITFVNVNYICGEPNSYSNLSEALLEFIKLYKDKYYVLRKPGFIITYLQLSDQNYIVATAQGKTLYTKPSDSIIGANSDDYYKFYFNSSYTGAYVEGRIIGANSEEGDPVVEVREDDYVILKPNDYIVENGRINKICNASYWRTLQWTNNTFPILNGDDNDGIDILDENNWKEVNYHTKESNEDTIEELKKLIETLQAGLISLGWSSED